MPYQYYNITTAFSQKCKTFNTKIGLTTFILNMCKISSNND